MKTQIVCAKCGQSLKSGQHIDNDDIFFVDNGLIFCRACWREYTAEIDRKNALERNKSRQNKHAENLPDREDFDSDIVYYIALAKVKNASDIHLNEGCGPFFRIYGSLETVSEKILTREDILTFVSAYTNVDAERFLHSDAAVDFSLTVSGIRLRGNIYKQAQEVNKKVCGNCYNYDYDGYVFVDELGERMKPDYLTNYFPAYIQRHGITTVSPMAFVPSADTFL